MKFSWQRLIAIIKKEFIQLKRDRGTLGMIIMLPIIQLLLFGYAINTDPKNLPTAIISEDNTFLTRSIVAGLQNSEYFRVTHHISSDKQGNKLLKQGKVFFVISIPDNFTQNVIRGANPEILLQADATDPTAISNAVSSLNGITNKIIQENMKGNLSYLKNQPSPFSIIVHKLYNPEGFTKYNIVPGLIGLVLIFSGVMMTALAITRERERGTMENLLSMPIKPIEIMMGKIIPFVFIGLFQVGIVLLIAYFLFSIPIFGSVLLLFSCSLLFIICNLAIGFLISTIAKNQTQALQMSVFVILPSVVMTGFMFPFQAMPIWAQAIAKCIPLTYFLKIARGIILKGADFIDIFPNLWPLGVIVAFLTIITLHIYKNTLD